MLMSATQPLDALENATEFQARHIGPRADDERHMLSVIGAASRRALLEAMCRRRSRALKVVDAPAGVLAFERTLGGESVFVAHNFGASPATMDAPGQLGRPLLVNAGAAAEGTKVTLPTRSSGAWRVSR